MEKRVAYDNPALQSDDPETSSPDVVGDSVTIDGVDDLPTSSSQSRDVNVAMIDVNSDIVSPEKYSEVHLSDQTLEINDRLSEDGSSSENGCTRCVVLMRKCFSELFRTYRRRILLLARILFQVMYHVFLASAIHYAVVHGNGIAFCDGVGLLLVITVLVYVTVIYYKLLVPYLGPWVANRLYEPVSRVLANLWRIRLLRLGLAAVTLCGIFIYLVVDTKEERMRLVSAFGLIILLLLSWVFSKHPGRVIWRHVFWGLGLQFVFGIAILRWQVGRDIFQCAGSKVSAFLDYTTDGSKFVFGFLVGGDQFVFAFSVLPVIIFFSFFIQILYYYGIMQCVIVKLGWLLQVTVGTTACESLNAAANIFVGQTEAPILVRPFLAMLTMSEMHAIMTGGFATIAGAVLVAYIQFGVSASHLLSASVMSAPAALAVSKLVYPETERSKTAAGSIKVDKGAEVNALDAASQGAMSVVKICGYIAASLIAFIAFISFVNGLLGWAGDLVGFQQNFGFPLTFQYLASQLLRPVALLMGVPWKDCGLVGELIALKVVLNEFVAYSELRKMMELGRLSQRSVTIATYALCGFSNFSSMGIQISGLSAMAPSRKSDLARLAFSAMIAGNIACFLTACVAGALIGDPSTVAATMATSTMATAAVVNATVAP